MQVGTFLVDFVGFRTETYPLVELADSGNHQAVVDRAKTLTEQITARHWPLESFGTSIRDFEHAILNRTLMEPDPYLTGEAFWVILGTYVRRIKYHIPDMTNWLLSLGWNTYDAELGGRGISYVELLKPSQAANLLLRPDRFDLAGWQDPTNYSWSFKPARAYETGWWDIEKIDYLYRKLSDARVDFEQFNVEAFRDDLQRINPQGLSLHDKILYHYRMTLKTYKRAMKEEMGLLTITAE